MEVGLGYLVGESYTLQPPILQVELLVASLLKSGSSLALQHQVAYLERGGGDKYLW